jgi:hypothetical protein
MHQTAFMPPGKAKRQRKQDASAATDPDVNLFADATCCQAVPDKTPNSSAWRPPATLRIGADSCSVLFNPPTVAALELHTRPMEGHPLMATAEVLFAEKRHCIWEWRRLACTAGAAGGGEVVGSEPLYVPRTEDIGARLRVTCTAVGADGPGEQQSTDSGVTLQCMHGSFRVRSAEVLV